MYKAISKFMSGIRQGLGNSLQRDKEKQDWINGIEVIKVEPYKGKKKKTIAKGSVKNKLYKDSVMLENKQQISQKNNPVKPNEKQPDGLRSTKKKKRGQPLLSKQKNLTALLLNTVPGKACPKCGKNFRGFNRDDKGSMTTKCCSHMTFIQR